MHRTFYLVLRLLCQNDDTQEAIVGKMLVSHGLPVYNAVPEWVKSIKSDAKVFPFENHRIEYIGTTVPEWVDPEVIHDIQLEIGEMLAQEFTTLPIAIASTT